MSVIGKTATSVQAECCRSSMRRLACLAVLAAFLLPTGAAQAQGLAALKAGLRAAGIGEVRGRVMGDESRFDARRGGPGSGLGVWVVDPGGPLSALSFNRGRASENGGSIRRNPPLFAAQQLTRELEKQGIDLTRS